MHWHQNHFFIIIKHPNEGTQTQIVTLLQQMTVRPELREVNLVKSASFMKHGTTNMHKTKISLTNLWRLSERNTKYCWYTSRLSCFPRGRCTLKRYLRVYLQVEDLHSFSAHFMRANGAAGASKAVIRSVSLLLVA